MSNRESRNLERIEYALGDKLNNLEYFGVKTADIFSNIFSKKWKNRLPVLELLGTTNLCAFISTFWFMRRVIFS